MNTHNFYAHTLLRDKNNLLILSHKQNILGEIYNENLKDLKSEYKLTTNFEHSLNKNIVFYINILFLKYGKVFFLEPITTIVKDNKVSLNYFKKSANKKNSQAQYNLAKCYYYGIGIKKNYKLALNYFLKSAEQNNPKAQYALAIIYLEGILVEENISKAIYYLNKAVSQKHTLAIIILSTIYKFGIKCKSNEKKAKEILNILKK